MIKAHNLKVINVRDVQPLNPMLLPLDFVEDQERKNGINKPKLKLRRQKSYEHSKGFPLSTIRSAYNAYKSSHYRKEELISYKKYSAFFKEVFKLIWKYIIIDRFVFLMPCGFGSVYIKEISPENHQGWYVDKKASKEHKRVIWAYNWHTKGRKFKVYWDRKLATFTDNSLYVFKPSNPQRDKIDLEYPKGPLGLWAYIMHTSETPELPDYRAHIIEP